MNKLCFDIFNISSSDTLETFKTRHSFFFNNIYKTSFVFFLHAKLYKFYQKHNAHNLKLDEN